MFPSIQPYQYVSLKKSVIQLVNNYHTVNDKETIQTLQAMTLAKVEHLFSEDYPEVAQLKNFILDQTITREKAEAYFEHLKNWIIPFKQPSNKQVEKIFKKTKKLNIPVWGQLNLREHSYIGWNDPGTQKKFILYYEKEQLHGISGELNSTRIKNICAICQKVSQVSMFLTTTKNNSDGTYIKKGNYICCDSEQCNLQLENIEKFHGFIQQMKK